MIPSAIAFFDVLVLLHSFRQHRLQYSIEYFGFCEDIGAAKAYMGEKFTWKKELEWELQTCTRPRPMRQTAVV